MAQNLLREHGVLPYRIVRPLQEFLQRETAGGILLLIATIAALAWINAPFGSTYQDFWDTHLTVDLQVLTLDESLRHWVNDALMALFFYVVGLEIKREVLQGELSEVRKAMLPVAAALGGMIVPAAIYYALNAGGSGADGWGIPMATDIAFAVGVVALVGSLVPSPMKVFLLALAIVDDIGAILVIAVFYSDGINFAWLGVALGIFLLVPILDRLSVRSVFVYLVVGAAAWLAVFESGVHATIAGVVLGLLTPAHPLGARADFSKAAHSLVEQHDEGAAEEGPESDEMRTAALGELEELARESQPILDRVERGLHPWTSYLIIPLFALANAGIEIDGGALADAVHSRVSIGVVLGLMIGKPLGILLFAWAATRIGIASIPSGTNWRQLGALACIAGIGFTVSLFISALAFGDNGQLRDAKLGILGASFVMGVIGFLALRLTTGGTPAVAED
jgi:NhaA family Na+:H+ antiporter